MMLEDMDNDIELIKRSVKKSIPNAVFTIASNKNEFIEKLKWQVPNIVLSDYHVPGYGGMEAMELVHREHPHIPFIFVTGTLNNEEGAANTILKGASGYVLKSNLKMLPDVMKEILESSRGSYEKGEEERRLVRRLHLTLQKLEAVSDSSTASDVDKEVIAKLISDVRNDLANKNKTSSKLKVTSK